jgi:hypothetical protein
LNPPHTGSGFGLASNNMLSNVLKETFSLNASPRKSKFSNLSGSFANFSKQEIDGKLTVGTY